MSERWLVAALTEDTSLGMEHWKKEQSGPLKSEYLTQQHGQKIESRHCCAPGVTKTFPPLPLINKQDLQDPTRSHQEGETKGALKLMDLRLRKWVKGQA